MNKLDRLLTYNQTFVSQREYEPFATDKFPGRGLAILACMDARLVELLPKALGLKNGDAKIIKNAGALITHLWGSVMRSLVISVYELRVEEIVVIAHNDCGMRALNAECVLAHAQKRGILPETIKTLRAAGIDLDTWLTGFDNVEDSVMHSVQTIKQHPLIPSDIPVHGLVIDPNTGALTVIQNGYEVS